MDSITQAALGGAIGEVFFGKKIGNKAAAVGAAVATIPDLDIVFLPFYSSVARLSIHRGFSHSIVFSIIGAFALSLVFKRLKWTETLSSTKVFLFMWLALFTHMLLDAFTTYGTQLLLPFSDYRVSFDSINIVDPVYTVPLLVGLLCSAWLYRNRPNRAVFSSVALVVSTTYLLGTLLVKKQVGQVFQSEANARGIKYEKLLTVPVGMSSVNWYGVLKTTDGIYLGKYSWYDAKPPLVLTFFERHDEYLEDIDPEVSDKLKWFAKGYYTVAKDSSGLRFYNLQCDMQGIQNLGDELAPTAFFFQVVHTESGYDLKTGFHEPRFPEP